MSTSHTAYATSIGEGLDYGVVRRVACPQCDQRDFVIGREPGRVWWLCFRAGCGIKGMTGDARLNPARVAALPSIMPYEGPALMPTIEDQNYFWSRFTLNRDVVDKHVRVTDRDEYLLPYRGPLGNIRGYVLRQPWWSGEPRAPRTGSATAETKTKLYRHTTEPKMAWYTGRYRQHVFVVEDQISAMRIAQALECPAVALMGNGINAEGVRDIARQKPRCVTIALDPNAQGAAQQMRVKWGGYFEKCRIVALEADPKDIPYNDLRTELL